MRSRTAQKQPWHGCFVARDTGGRTQRAVLNLGWRPTVAQTTPQLQVEAHLLDFAGDLYDTELEITFVGKLREEQKFPSRAALQEQIGRDIAAAQRLF